MNLNLPSLALPRTLFALLFIALSAYLTTATAQNASFDLLGKPAQANSAASAVVTTDQVRAELLAWAPQGITPGQPVWLGLQITHQPEWHTYWKNSGDSGLPTVLEWTLPDGLKADDIAWPTPTKIPLGNLANYGYEGVVLLPVPVRVAPGFSGTEIDVTLKAAWLVCRKECIPQEGVFSLRLPANSSVASSAGIFQKTFDATPQPLAAAGAYAEVKTTALQVSLPGLPAAWVGKTLAFFPETGGVLEPAGQWQQSWQGSVWTAQLPLSSQRTDSPRVMPLVVALPNAGAPSPGAYRVEAPVKGEWPPSAAPVAVPAALQAALQANANNAAANPAASAPSAAGAFGLGATFFGAVFGALLGGLLLNLMPCVFPVLAIKVVGFVNVKSPAARARSGAAYTAGVVLSFLALGGLLLGLRAAGEQLGWGFQLQSPAAVAALAVLFTVIGLNLAGLFEFGHVLPSRLASLQAKNPTVDAFLSGVLATAVASPCTAPFMGASLGYAVGLPGAQALVIFAAIGLGMALPYWVASLVPALARAMPRPGPWMVTFKQLMAFPMFATVAWLVWVLGQQSGIDGAGALLALLVLLALVLWALTLAGRSRAVLATLSIAAGLGFTWAIGPNIIKLQDATAPQASAGWQTWEPGRVDQMTAQGRSVFVDFTAAWCVTCQYNKQTTLADDAVLADMRAKNVALLRADWTRRDPAITAALAELGRSGVPVYVIYKAGRAPVVLSEILSVDGVRAEIARL